MEIEFIIAVEDKDIGRYQHLLEEGDGCTVLRGDYSVIPSVGDTVLITKEEHLLLGKVLERYFHFGDVGELDIGIVLGHIFVDDEISEPTDTPKLRLIPPEHKP